MLIIIDTVNPTLNIIKIKKLTVKLRTKIKNTLIINKLVILSLQEYNNFKEMKHQLFNYRKKIIF